MGIQTIAESVESEAVLKKLGDIGVNYAQGYAISRPIPFVEDWREISNVGALAQTA